MIKRPKGYQAISERIPWTYDGKRVIDRYGKWMGYWYDVPVTISSMLAGWQQEAYTRRNPDLKIHDLRARMPDEFLAKKTKRYELQRTWDQTVLTNRAMRFRWDTFNIVCMYFDSQSKRRLFFAV